MYYFLNCVCNSDGYYTKLTFWFHWKWRNEINETKLLTMSQTTGSHNSIYSKWVDLQPLWRFRMTQTTSFWLFFPLYGTKHKWAKWAYWHHLFVWLICVCPNKRQFWCKQSKQYHFWRPKWRTTLFPSYFVCLFWYVLKRYHFVQTIKRALFWKAQNDAFRAPLTLSRLHIYLFPINWITQSSCLTFQNHAIS